jgi:hypothetical protein
VRTANVALVKDREHELDDMPGVFLKDPPIVSAEGTLVGRGLCVLLVEDEIANVFLEGSELLLADYFPPPAATLTYAIHYMIDSNMMSPFSACQKERLFYIDSQDNSEQHKVNKQFGINSLL